MNTLKINVPEGFEIDKDKSTFEEWRPMPFQESTHEVSSFGRVRIREKTYFNGKKRSSKITITDKIVHLKKDKDGYLSVCVQNNNEHKYYKVHRLVASAFILNHENKPQVNHINGIKDDNRVENLEWSTSLENINHSRDVIKSIGILDKSPFAKIVMQFDLSMNFIKEWGSVKSASLNLDVNKNSISLCCLGRQKTAGGFVWKYKDLIEEASPLLFG